MEVCERLATRVPRASRFVSHRWGAVRVLFDRFVSLPGCKQNTIDLQWENDGNYKARPCDGKRKAAGAETMKNNGKTMEKTMRRTMETVGNPGACDVRL
jgi:hypothetical protein